MATANKQTLTKNGRKLGRPTNAERQARFMQSNAVMIEVVAKAASSAAEGAVRAYLDSGQVQTVGIPQPAQRQAPTPPAATTTPTAPKATKGKKSVGRKPDPTSNRFKAFAMYNELRGTMPRNEIVNKFVANLGLKKNVANTYYHEAEAKSGDRKPGKSGKSSTSTGVAAAA